MHVITWLNQEMSRRSWDALDLARQAELSPIVVQDILSGQEVPDFEFCYGVALALDKQPARVLNMAGLLSDAGLKLANDLARSQALSGEAIRRAAWQLPVEERRLIVACADRQGIATPLYDELRPRPDEFNPQERRQDRLRFMLTVLFLLLTLIGVSIAVGLILLL